MTSNYFKTSEGALFFFVDTVQESAVDAFVRASARSSGVPSVFRAVPIPGPWDVCGIIGHRSRKAILQDLAIEMDSEELNRLHSELTALQGCYTDVGRSLPSATL